MEIVESNLGDIGRKCNSRLLDQMGKNNEEWIRESRAQGTCTLVP